MRAFTLTLLLAMAAGPALAQQRQDPDWPCAQRRVPTIGYGAVWTGPDPTGAASEWGNDREAAQLARKLASRRTELREADTLIDEFAEKLDPAEKQKRLTHVFAGVYEIVTGERSTVMNGIVRYAQGQRRLAERIRDEADKVSELKDSPDNDTTKVSSKEVAELETKFNWDRRIFDERNQSVSYVCEVPTLLEQRLGEIAKRIQAKL
ncbi:hypothetical protein [Methylorubrum sp. SB2]|uniref:hypothetical protein n=1 Tax=Methylorubrum subtropicum TaxID=3138812 RepID=UPI00313E692B